jgi:hypothetical protein
VRVACDTRTELIWFALIAEGDLAGFLKIKNANNFVKGQER